MKTILVSIISEQAIPNVLIIKEMKGKYDELLFITTDFVESKGMDCWIENACELEEHSVKRIKVIEDNLTDILEKLTGLDKQNTRYLVNISGGTKVMTIGVYSFFACNQNQIIYVPIGKNKFNQIYPSALETAIHYRLNLSEYLTAYGC